MPHLGGVVRRRDRARDLDDRQQSARQRQRSEHDRAARRRRRRLGDHQHLGVDREGFGGTRRDRHGPQGARRWTRWASNARSCSPASVWSAIRLARRPEIAAAATGDGPRCRARRAASACSRCSPQPLGRAVREPRVVPSCTTRRRDADRVARPDAERARRADRGRLPRGLDPDGHPTGRHLAGRSTPRSVLADGRRRRRRGAAPHRHGLQLPCLAPVGRPTCPAFAQTERVGRVRREPVRRLDRELRRARTSSPRWCSAACSSACRTSASARSRSAPAWLGPLADRLDMWADLFRKRLTACSRWRRPSTSTATCASRRSTSSPRHVLRRDYPRSPTATASRPTTRTSKAASTPRRAGSHARAAR